MTARIQRIKLALWKRHESKFFCCSYFRCLKVYRYHSFVFLIIIRWKKTITCGVLLSNPKSIWNLKTGYAAQMFGLKKIFECYCLMESFRSATFFFSYSVRFRHILITVSNSIIFLLRSTWIVCLLGTGFLFGEKNRLPNLFCAWKKGSFWNEILAKLLGWAIFVLRFPIPLFFLFR